MSEARQPSAWSEFGDGHDYSRSGKHDPLACRPCMRAHIERLSGAVRADDLTDEALLALGELARRHDTRDARIAAMRRFLAGGVMVVVPAEPQT